MDPVRFKVPVPAVGVNQTYRVGRGRKVYKSREARDFKNAVIFAAKHAMRGRDKFMGNVEARILFAYPTHRNDIDGGIKPTLDALNGNVWQDDRQVIGLEVRKVKDVERPRVEIEVWDVGYPDPVFPGGGGVDAAIEENERGCSCDKCHCSPKEGPA